jgi:hypothetical protein
MRSRPPLTKPINGIAGCCARAAMLAAVILSRWLWRERMRA